MKQSDIIKKLAQTSSRLEKIQILKEQYESGNKILFDAFHLAYDPMITFGVFEINHTDFKTNTSTWDDFIILTNNLISRNLTGNAAKSAISEFAENTDVDEWEHFYKSILTKDMRCGVNVATINSVMRDDKIKIFSVQLAQDGTDVDLNGDNIVDIKLDGVRVITIVYPNGVVNMFSRNGKELHNFNKVKSQFETIAKNLRNPMVFDGEIVSKNFNMLMTQLNRKTNVNADDSHYYLFDMLTLDDFENGISKIKQLDRRIILNSWFESVSDKFENVYILDYDVVNFSTDEGLEKFNQINKSAIENQYEGVMIKNPNALYQCKRSANWLKIKPFISVTLRVDSIEEGTGRNKSRLGALICSGIDNGKEIYVNVGSGFSDGQRVEFYTNEIIGNLVEVKADAISVNQNGTYSLRFPRFLRFRNLGDNNKI